MSRIFEVGIYANQTDHAVDLGIAQFNLELETHLLYHIDNEHWILQVIWILERTSKFLLFYIGDHPLIVLQNWEGDFHDIYLAEGHDLAKLIVYPDGEIHLFWAFVPVASIRAIFKHYKRVVLTTLTLLEDEYVREYLSFVGGAASQTIVRIESPGASKSKQLIANTVLFLPFQVGGVPL